MFWGVGRKGSTEENLLSLSSGWLISQCPVGGIILLLSDTHPLSTQLKERFFLFRTYEPEGRLRRPVFWQLSVRADGSCSNGLGCKDSF